MSPDKFVLVVQIILAVACFAAVWISCAFKKEKPDVGNMFLVGLTGASLPIPFVMLYAAFDVEILTKFSQSSVYIALTACAAFFLFVNTIWEKLR